MRIVEADFGALLIEATPEDYVPRERRAAWLAKHGKPEPRRVRVAAPMAIWEAAGVELGPEGQPTGIGVGYGVGAALAAAVADALRAAPSVAELEAEPVLQAYGARRQAEEAEKAAAAAEQERADAEQADRIAAALRALRVGDVLDGDGEWVGPAAGPWTHGADPVRDAGFLLQESPSSTWGPRSYAIARDATRAAVETIREERRRRVAAAVEREKAREAEYEVSARAYAVERFDDLARAAREGYEVTSQVLDRIAAAIGGEGCRVYRRGTREYDRFTLEDRKAPRADAFRVLDEVTERVKATSLPAHVTAEVQRVQRYRETDDHLWSTAVVVYLSTPGKLGGKALAIVVPVEPFGRRRGDEDEEEE